MKLIYFLRFRFVIGGAKCMTDSKAVVSEAGEIKAKDGIIEIITEFDK